MRQFGINWMEYMQIMQVMPETWKIIKSQRIDRTIKYKPTKNRAVTQAKKHYKKYKKRSQQPLSIGKT